MNFILQRYSDNGESTQGILLTELSRQFICHTLEDEFRAVKVIGETRIDAGRYKLSIRKEDTPLTLKHRESYNKNYPDAWFKYHIEITGLPRHKGVYIHAGNTEEHSQGCLLCGDTIGNHTIEKDQLSRSIQAVKRFYDLCYPELEKGEDCFIAIRDEKALF